MGCLCEVLGSYWLQTKIWAETWGACAGSCLMLAIDRNPSHLWCTVYVGTPIFPPCAAQMQTQVQVPLFLIVVHCPKPLLLLSCCAATQWIRWGLHGLLVNIRVWAGWRATIRVLGPFWCAAWIMANNGYHSSTQALLWDWVTSVSTTQFSP